MQPGTQWWTICCAVAVCVCCTGAEVSCACYFRWGGRAHTFYLGVCVVGGGARVQGGWRGCGARALFALFVWAGGGVSPLRFVCASGGCQARGESIFVLFCVWVVFCCRPFLLTLSLPGRAKLFFSFFVIQTTKRRGALPTSAPAPTTLPHTLTHFACIRRAGARPKSGSTRHSSGRTSRPPPLWGTRRRWPEEP
jgi:hypothetical protein